MKKNDPFISLCRIDDIPSGEARGFMPDKDIPHKRILVINHAHKIIVYENRCPHAGTPLDWVPDQFLNESLSYLQCSTHGALFRIEDGFCIFGPCMGQSLKQIPHKVWNNQIMIYFD
jgi:nitrite reductase/ring-hydroxylating ferredoxin subunit